MSNITEIRNALIEREAKRLTFELFSNMVVDGWQIAFQNRIKELLKEHSEVNPKEDIYQGRPWESYNLFTGYRRRFYYSDNPIESAEKYFAVNYLDNPQNEAQATLKEVAGKGKKTNAKNK
jgi:hypothetical protein